MPVYAGYRGDEIVQPNYSQIALQGVNKLYEIEAERKAQRLELDQMQVDQLAEINKTQLGKSDNMNTFVTKGAQNSRAFLLEQNKLLKAGKISADEYKLNMQRMKDGWGALVDSKNNFEATYNKALELAQSEKASKLDMEVLSGELSMGNLTDMQFYVDPTSGATYVIKTNEKGDIINQMPTATIGVARSQSFGRYDLEQNAAIVASKFGVTTGKDAEGNLVKSQRMDANYQANLTNAVNNMASQPNVIERVLVDNMGYSVVTPYEYSQMPDSEKAMAVVKMQDRSGSFMFQYSDEQRKAAMDYMAQTIDSKMSYDVDYGYQQREQQLEEQRRSNKVKEAQGWAAIDASRTKASGAGTTDAPLIGTRYALTSDFANNPKNSAVKSQLIGKKTNMGTIASIRENKDGGVTVFFVSEWDPNQARNVSKKMWLNTAEERLAFANEALNDGLGQKLMVTTDQLMTYRAMMGNSPVSSGPSGTGQAPLNILAGKLNGTTPQGPIGKKYR